MSARYDLEF